MAPWISPVSQVSKTRAESDRNFSRAAITSSSTSQSSRIFTGIFWQAGLPGGPICQAPAGPSCPPNARRMACRCEHGCVHPKKILQPILRCWSSLPAPAAAQRKAIPCSNADGCVGHSCPQTTVCGLDVKPRYDFIVGLPAAEIGLPRSPSRLLNS